MRLRFWIVGWGGISMVFSCECDQTLSTTDISGGFLMLMILGTLIRVS